MKNSTYAVIAAKNEAKHISAVVKDTKKYVNKVIVVDDGSSDNTSEKAKEAGAIVLQHLVNLGKGAATKTGCEYAISKGAETIVFLDADGQHEPKDIIKFKEKLKEKDIVFGIRKRNKHMPAVLKLGNWFLNKAANSLYGIDVPDTQCGFRTFKTKIYFDASEKLLVLKGSINEKNKYE